ncbi:MAG: ABC transporter permease [Actinomycetaceae bacterium]|nr:ABC transporter permease [Actinomycetaceae bacterium]
MIFVATNLVYFLASAFLDPRANYFGRRPPVPESQVDAILTPMNLNDKVPILERWWAWLKGILLHWDWGQGFVQKSVNDAISHRMWVSAELVMGATILAVIVGVALGVYTASRQYKLSDRIWQAVSLVAMNTHTVVAAVVLVFLAVQINRATGHTIFYVTGNAGGATTNIFAALLQLFQKLALPTISLVFISYASYHLTQRSLLLDNIEMDYVRTARAKGLTRHQAIRKHALRTSIIPVATSVAFSIPGVFTGATLTESIYAWQGMGQYLVQTISKNDVNGVVATAAFTAVLTAVGAILSDIFVVALDPRVRVS